MKHPEMDWKHVKAVLENNGFKEINLKDRLYVHMQKGKKNIRIPKLNKIPALCLQHIITSSEITEQQFAKITAE